jgi:hypothetical protein
MPSFGGQYWDSNKRQEEKTKNGKEPTFVFVHNVFEAFLLATSWKERAGSLVNVSVSVHATVFGIVVIIPDSTWFHRDWASVLKIAGIGVEPVDVGSGILATDMCREKRLDHFIEFDVLESCFVGKRRVDLWGV